MIYGYSERGIFNSIIYYLDANPELIGKFLEILKVEGFSNETHSFTFLNEQSFSDFGDCDLTIIAERNDTKEKTVIFVEGKRGKNYSIEKEFKKIIKSDVKRFNTSNLFIQLYFKYLLSRGNDYEEITLCLQNLITKQGRKIGKNKVVLNARENYIKNANQYCYVAIIPKQPDNSKKIQEHFEDLNLMIDVIDYVKCAFWQDIEAFFISEKAENVIENFKYNEGQIY